MREGTDDRDGLLARGLGFESRLPGPLAVQAAELVARGAFASFDELLMVAVGSYLDMRRHPDVASLLHVRLGQEADASGELPFVQARADALARHVRPAPMSASEAIAAVG